MRTGAERGSRDLYEVLKVEHDASADELRASFKRLAAEHHPDRSPGDPKAALRFKRINAAYQVLSDPTKRREYDALTAPIEDFDDPSWNSPRRGVTPPPSSPRESGPSFKSCPECGEAVADWLAACACGFTFESGSAEVPRAEDRSQKQVRRAGTRRAGPLRTLLKLVAWLAAVAVLGTGGLVWYAAKEDRDRQAEQDSVKVSAEYRPERCTSEAPILVTIQNDAARTVKSVSFHIEAYEQGQSDDLAASNGLSKSTDVIPPGRILRTCWSVPRFDRATKESVLFRAQKGYFDSVTFYDSGEFVPPEPTETSADAATTADPASATAPGLSNETSTPNPFRVGDRWVGSYACAQGQTAMTMVVTAVTNYAVSATFDFRADQASGSFAISGRFDPSTHAATFRPGGWIRRPAESWSTVGMRGTVDVRSRTYSGSITTTGCGAFTLRN
jgi:hypothetical protein